MNKDFSVYVLTVRPLSFNLHHKYNLSLEYGNYQNY